jgi:hypothetical protein
MNPITEKIIDARKGHYCHCVEVSDVYELEAIAEQVVQEFCPEFSEETIIDFLESLTVYSLNDENEEDIYNFSFREYCTGTID